MILPPVSEAKVVRLAIALLYPDPANPRKTFDKSELQRLADSLKARGMLQPIRVVYDPEREAYRIVCGESRWHAAKLANWSEVPCLLAEGELSEAELLADQLIENMVRSDLAPMDAARGIARLKLLEGCSSSELGRKYGINPSEITKAEKLLSLEPEIQSDIDAGLVPPDTGYYLARAEPELRRELWQQVRAKGMKRDEVAKAVRDARKTRPKRPKRVRQTWKRGALTLTYHAKSLALESFLEELTATLEAVREAQKEGVADLPAFFKRLRAETTA